MPLQGRCTICFWTLSRYSGIPTCRISSLLSFVACEPFPKLHLLELGCLEYPNRMAYCGADHLFGATSPAFVKPRVAHQDREVIAASVMAGAGAGRTPCHIVPPDLAYLTHVSQDVELRPALLSAILPDLR